MRSDCWGWNWLGAIVLSAELISSPAAAQIAPDGTTATTIDRLGDRVTIEGGDRAGGNLFHSFREFSIPTNGEAYFNNAVDITNIFSRVTGGEISNIDGLIRANGTANLFLLNPAGIIFGPNARLSLGGSFFGTTARSIQFADGVEFAADAPAIAPLLTLSVPVGLQFGANPGAIGVRGNGVPASREITGSTTEDIRQAAIAVEQDFLANPDGLRVLPGQTLALIGSTVALDQAVLKAADGRIALGTGAANDVVVLRPDDLGFAVALPPVPIAPLPAAAADMSLTGSILAVSGNSGGEVLLWGNQIDLNTGTLIFTKTLGDGNGRGIRISADRLNLNDARLTTDRYSNIASRSGDITIQAGSLTALNSQIRSNVTFGQGRAGDITMTVRDEATFDRRIGSDSEFTEPAGIISRLETEAIGQSGNITVRAQNLLIANGAELTSETFGIGDAGNINLTIGNQLTLIGESAVSSSSYEAAIGNSGSIAIRALRLLLQKGSTIISASGGLGDGGTINVQVGDDLTMLEDSSITTSLSLTGIGRSGELSVSSSILTLDQSNIFSDTFGQGNAGLVTVQVGSIFLQNSATSSGQLVLQNGSGISSSSSRNATGNAGTVSVQVSGDLDIRENSKIATEIVPSAAGNGGNISVSAGNLAISDGGRISASTAGSGNGGLVQLAVDDHLDISGWLSRVSSETSSTTGGQAGTVSITARSIMLNNGGQISSSTNGLGDAGTVTVQARDYLNLAGRDSEISSAGAGFAQGNSGSILISVPKLFLDQQASISSSNLATGFAAGDVTIAVDQLGLDREATITANTVGDRGNINIAANTITLRNRSQIATNARGAFPGGNLTINTQTLTALNNSDISANAQNALGGRVTIATEGIFGTAFRAGLTPDSDITATSALGPQFSGVVQITTPDIDPSSGLVQLPDRLADLSTLIDQTFCRDVARSGGSFTITGRGGIAITPDAFLDDPGPLNIEPLELIARSTSPADHPSIASESRPPTRPIVEANTWQREPDGRLILVAQGNAIAPPGLRLRDCPLPSTSAP